MSNIWYRAEDVRLIDMPGEVYSVSQCSRGLYLEISHRGVQLADCLDSLAGELFFRLIHGQHHYVWMVLNADRLNRELPDAVFIPEGVNQGIVYERLLTHLSTAQ